jgi:prepilin-type N-terminal cleavage/methylation domain-containing protein/prepilin-type processing-associated H-X9-DG protein
MEKKAGRKRNRNLRSTNMNPDSAVNDRVCRQSSSGFTLVELLVVVAIIAILAALLLPVLSRAKRKARETSCRNNLHQLGIAFTSYCHDNADNFPAPGSKRTYGPHAEDWIWWQVGRDVKGSAIVSHLNGFNPSLFRCPQDTIAQDWKNGTATNGASYPYSYSLTSYDLENDQNSGMSTIITKKGKIYYFKMSYVKNPSGKIMLVDEDRKTLDDSRWIPVDIDGRIGYTAIRHDGKGALVFADGHVQVVLPTYAYDKANSQPTY